MIGDLNEKTGLRSEKLFSVCRLNEPAHAKRYKMVKVFDFFIFLHKTKEICRRIYFLVFCVFPKSEENLITDVIKCCHYNDKFYYVILKLNMLK